MSYDHWKTTNPADNELGPEPATETELEALYRHNERLRKELLEAAESIARGVAGKIHAIKAYRASTGARLMDSKKWVESFNPPLSINGELMDCLDPWIESREFFGGCNES